MKEGAIVGKVYRKIRFEAIYIFAFCLMVGGIMHYVDVKGDSFGNIFVLAGFKEKKALPIMCCTLGIECWYVTGNVYESNGELIGYHAWNRVVLEGKGYYMDACWNDSSGNAYFLSENGWADHKIDGEFETYRISSQVFPMPEYIPARAS